VTPIECGIKAYDIHELLPHLVAKTLGYYADEELEVRVVDVTFVRDEDLPPLNYFQVACGAAYLGRRDGHPFKVVLAATDRPMFWLHARTEIETVEALAGGRVATYPPVAPPHYFHRITLQNHDVDPDTQLEFRPARDDLIRLAMLRDGDVDGAAISSAISPFTVENLGLRRLAYFGDELRFVTTGIATTERVLDEQPEIMASLVRVFRRSLDAIHGSPDAVLPIVARALRESDDVAAATYDDIRSTYTRDGRVPAATLATALERVGREVPFGADVGVDDLYDFSLLDGLPQSGT
jgi:ABC-type nitrate/sulfonate/bicarbonate transport system substrate-binding protein